MSSCQEQNPAGGVPGGEATRESLGLYVHIPFCLSRCLYCDFRSTATARPPWDAYLEALLSELHLLGDSPFAGRHLETLFVGGGTPSLCPPRFLDRLFRAVFTRFPPLPGIETTVECNPGTVARHRLEQLRALGVNRLSIGIQSFHDDHLETLTRIHRRTEALEAIRAAVEAGFDNLSADLIWGIPGQTVGDWVDDLETLVSFPIQHCATYGLTVYEGTILADQVARGRLALPSETDLVAMFHATQPVLSAAGFTRYEISNWSRGRPCRHNLRYWEGRDWLGIGSAAHAYSDRWTLERGTTPHLRFVPARHGGRWWTHPQPDQYMAACAAGRSPYAGWETLTRQQAMTEVVMTELRTLRGLDLDRLSARFGRRAAERVAARSRRGPFSGLVERTNSHIRLTSNGFLLSDRIILELSEAADEGLASEDEEEEPWHGR